MDDRATPPQDAPPDSTQPQFVGIVYDDLTWGESPRAHEDVLWVSDTQGGRLVEVRPEGARVHELDTPVNGTSFLPSGDLLAAGMTSQRIERLSGGNWHLHADLAPIGAGRLGDMTTRADGTAYVDALGTQSHESGVDDSGRILMVDPSGRASVAADGLVWPNGLALVGGSSLVVAETFAGRLTEFDVAADGSLSNPRLWLDLSAELGPDFLPDGLWPTTDGSVWAATTAGNAAVLTRRGEVVRRLDLDGFAVALCLSADERDLYVTVAESFDPGEPVLSAVARKHVRARVERYRLEPNGLPIAGTEGRGAAPSDRGR